MSAQVAGVHLSAILNSDTLDSQAINAIFHAHMTVVSGGNVCGLATICLVELFVYLATSLLIPLLTAPAMKFCFCFSNSALFFLPMALLNKSA